MLRTCTAYGISENPAPTFADLKSSSTNEENTLVLTLYWLRIIH